MAKIEQLAKLAAQFELEKQANLYDLFGRIIMNGARGLKRNPITSVNLAGLNKVIGPNKEVMKLLGRGRTGVQPVKFPAPSPHRPFILYEPPASVRPAQLTSSAFSSIPIVRKLRRAAILNATDIGAGVSRQTPSQLISPGLSFVPPFAKPERMAVIKGIRHLPRPRHPSRAATRPNLGV